MKALIIAAGRGERLKPFTDEMPKPLMPLLGLRLIERVILAAREAGIKEFVIITGYLGEKLKSFLGDGSKYRIKIDYVENRRWKLGNGFSVYEARNLLQEKFILLMSDHIFNRKILSGLKRCEIGEGECILCVDRKMKYVFDKDDATKVKVVGDKILQIGKDLEEYNGADMGIFLCSSHIFKVLEKNIEEKHYSLTDTVRELANMNKMKTYCIENNDYYWIDVDTFETLKIAENILSNFDPIAFPHPEKMMPERGSKSLLSSTGFLDSPLTNEDELLPSHSKELRDQ